MNGARRRGQGVIAHLFGRISGRDGANGAGLPAPQTPDQARLLDSLSRLAGGVAHDLNNILLVIQGYTEMALAEPDAGPSTHALLAEVKDAAGRASLLVHELLVLGQRGPFSPRLLSLDEAILHHLPLVMKTAGESIEVHHAPGGDVPMVVADEELIGLLLKAFCLRARESSPKGGSITIATSVRRAEKAGDHPPDDFRGEQIILRVTDTGNPMTEEARARLFEPYLPSPTGGKGTGLGMSIAYAAARRLGAQIELERSSVEGTVFTCAFPARRAAGMSPRATAERQGVAAGMSPGATAGMSPGATAGMSPGATAGMSPGATAGAFGRAGVNANGAVTILLAEDDEGIRALATKVLAREGYQVLAANDGEQAVEIFEREAGRISLVVLDDVMPRMGGRAALALMRGKVPDLPAILCSGYTWQLDGSASPGVGISRVLAKPWQPLELLRRVREGLGA